MSETEALKALLGETIKEAVREVLNERKPDESGQQTERYYTRDQICEKLDICHATFHNWQNKGVFKTKKIEGRVYVLADAFDEDFKEDKFVKFRIKPRRK